MDRTRHRADTFFGSGIVAHVSLAHPFCPVLRESAWWQRVHASGVPVHDGGTYLCMEGPQFSTQAESFLYRSWGMDVIGMTNLQEAKLAREAEICYATLALVTDYDCWHPDHDHVRIEDVLKIMHDNTEHAQAALGGGRLGASPRRRAAPASAPSTTPSSPSGSAWPEETYHRLRPLLETVLEGSGRDRMKLLIVGSVAYDTVKTPFGERERVLGGSASYSSLAASFFTRVGPHGRRGRGLRSRRTARSSPSTASTPAASPPSRAARPSTGRASTGAT